MCMRLSGMSSAMAAAALLHLGCVTLRMRLSGMSSAMAAAVPNVVPPSTAHASHLQTCMCTCIDVRVCMCACMRLCLCMCMSC